MDIKEKLRQRAIEWRRTATPEQIREREIEASKPYLEALALEERVQEKTGKVDIGSI